MTSGWMGGGVVVSFLDFFRCYMPEYIHRICSYIFICDIYRGGGRRGSLYPLFVTTTDLLSARGLRLSKKSATSNE